MELAVVYKLNPPVSMTENAPITYTCTECEQSILSQNVEAHTKGTHHTDLYVLKNMVEPPTSPDRPAQGEGFSINV